MPGIEFVGTDTGGDADDDVLDTGPRRPVPRWVWVVAVLAVVAVAVGVLVSSRSDGSPTARTTPAVSTSAGPSADVAAPVEQISALTSDGTSLFWITGNRLFRAGPTGRASISTALSPTDGEFTGVQLVADPQERTVWVVSRGSTEGTGSTGDIEGFATGDLTRVVRASARALVTGAAALDGALYVLSGGHLLRMTATSAGPTPVAVVDRQAHDLVAVGNALLYLEGGNSSALGRWTPSGVQKPTVLDVVDGSLAVAGSTVFLLGTRQGGPELDTLDARTGAIAQRAVATGLDGPLQLVATGRRSVIVLGSGRRGAEFACVTTANQVDAPGPAKVQALAVSSSAAVAVLQTQVFQGDGDTVRPVTFNVGRCST